MAEWFPQRCTAVSPFSAPKVKPEPLGARRRRGQSRKKSRTAEPEAQQVLVYDPEEGWDDETDPHCKVLEFGTDGKEVERRGWLLVWRRYVTQELTECVCSSFRCRIYRQDGLPEGCCARRVLLPEDLW